MLNKYTPEQLKRELGACWEVDEIADLMAACGLEAADALDVLDAPTNKHEDVIWMACRMMPSVCAAFARRCAEDAGTNAASASASATNADDANTANAAHFAAHFAANAAHFAANAAANAARAASASNAAYTYAAATARVLALRKYRGWLREEISC